MKYKSKVHFFVLSLLVFLPFAGNGSPIFGLFYLAWAVLIICSTLYMAEGVKDGKFSSLFTIAIIFVLGLLALIKGVHNPHTNVVETVSIIFAIPLVHLLANVYDDERLRVSLAIFVLTISCIHGIAGIEQLISGRDILWGNPPPGGRPSGLFSWGAPVVGSFTGIGLLFYYCLPKVLRQKKIFISVYIFLLFVILISGNRSILIIHVVILVLHLIFKSKQPGITILIISASVIFIGPIFLEFLFVIASKVSFLSENQLYRLSSLAGGIIEEQKSKRIATWIQTFCMIADSPWVGYPIGGYQNYLSNYLYCAANSEGIMPHPHSILLELLVMFGMFIAALLTFVTWYLLLRSYRSNPDIRFSMYVAVGFISPLNMTHGLVSFWWIILLSIIVGVGIATKQ